MRFGCCGSMISPRVDPLGAAIMEELAELGFDYIELSLRDITGLSKSAFADLSRRLEQAHIHCEACNNFFPPEIRLTGATANLPLAFEYAKRAIDRAAQLGVEIIVFGSANSKNVPPGFAHAEALRQIAELLQMLGPAAREHGIVIVIEPLNQKESNIITLAAEGLQLVYEVGHPNIKMLIDYYHMKMEDEDAEIVLKARTDLRHVHFAEGEARVFPTEEHSGYAQFFDCLKRIEYAGRCSIEAYTDNFSRDSRSALVTLKAIAARMGM